MRPRQTDPWPDKRRLGQVSASLLPLRSRGLPCSSVRPFAPTGFPALIATMASADSCTLKPPVSRRGCPGQRDVAAQVSPDKCVSCHRANAAFTLSPDQRASSCCADSPRNRALYAVRVPRLAVLFSGFLRTIPRGTALAFDYSLLYSDPPKGDSNPMSSHTCWTYTIASTVRLTRGGFAVR